MYTISPEDQNTHKNAFHVDFFKKEKINNDVETAGTWGKIVNTIKMGQIHPSL